MARDAQAVALNAFAHAHAPLPELLALCPAAVPMALPSILPSLVIPSLVLPMAPAPEILDDVAPVLALCPTLVPIAFSSFVPDDSVHRWLTAALPLVLAPFIAEAVPTSAVVIPVVAEAAPVVKKSRRSKATDTKTEKTLTDKNPRKRSPKTATTATIQ